MPTLAAYAGINLQAHNIKTEGISLIPVLSGDVQNQKTHDYLYWEFQEGKQAVQAIRQGKWKAVRHAGSKTIELYDLENDRSEQQNLADKHPELISKFLNKFKKARTPNPYWKMD